MYMMRSLTPYILATLLSGFIAWTPLHASTPKQSFDKGYRQHLKGNHADAVKYYTKAIKRKPSYAQAYLMRAAAHHSMKEYERAMKDYTRVIESGDNYFKAVGHFNRGVVQYDIGKYSAAITDFTWALSYDHKMAAAYLHRGIAKGRAGDKKGQVQDFVYAARSGDSEVRGWLEKHAPHVLGRK
ncbi:tetratricopeptide repeat protein [Prosthecochloris sp. SCSIO W1103]|nr:tetratricopeptide repeat protein [Prosthecochloris sp. SCSIO W1103]UZJ37715.1 tetratricopeptide repeat protein [Prosthecochloris sp. SCSIO W1103]